MKLIWEEKLKVYSFQIDKKGKLTVPWIAGILQEVAGNHAEHLGFGWEDMQKKGLVWLLSRLKIEVHRFPLWKEEFFIRTWVVENRKLLSRRDFEILSMNNEKLISAMTEWIAYDFKNKKPFPPSKFNVTFSVFVGKKAIEKGFSKIKFPDKPDSSSEYEVKYSDIDIVGHMNNKEYIRMILDTYSYRWYENHSIKNFEIHFKSDARLEDNLKIYTKRENDTFLHGVKKKDKVICIVKITW